MSRILMLTDRPQEDESLVARAFELAERLNADEVAAVVTQSEAALLPSGMLFGIPDAGLLPQEMSPALLLGDADKAASEHFFDRCRQEAAYSEVNFETIRANASLRRTAAILANAVGLLMVSRESLIFEDGELVPLRTLWSEVAAPWLICPNEGEPWRRIVVAACDGRPRDRLLAWGGHWSRRLDVPLAVIELHPSPRHSAWSAVSRWLPWNSPRHHREVVRNGLLTCGLGPSDLLLVDRESAEWPFAANNGAVTLDDLVAVAPCALGIAPTSLLSATRELLYPHGMAHVNGSIMGLGIVAA